MPNFVYYYFFKFSDLLLENQRKHIPSNQQGFKFGSHKFTKRSFCPKQGKSEKTILCFISRSRLGRRICYSTFIKLTLLKCPLSFPPREYIYLNNEIMCYKLYPLTLNDSLKYAFTKDGKEATV